MRPCRRDARVVECARHRRQRELEWGRRGDHRSDDQEPRAPHHRGMPAVPRYGTARRRSASKTDTEVGEMSRSTPTGYHDAVDAARRLSEAGLAAMYTGPCGGPSPPRRSSPTRAECLTFASSTGSTTSTTAPGRASPQARQRPDPEAYSVYETSPGDAVCPHGERLIDAQRRMLDALRLIGSRHPGESVAAVTHAVMIRLAVMELTGVDGRSWRQPVRHDSVTELFVENHTIRFAAHCGHERCIAPLAPGRDWPRATGGPADDRISDEERGWGAAGG